MRCIGLVAVGSFVSLVVSHSVSSADVTIGLDADRLQRTLSIAGDLSFGEQTQTNHWPDYVNDPLSDPYGRELIENTKNEYRGGFIQIALAAGALSDLTALGADSTADDAEAPAPGSLNASAEVAWEIPLCRIVGAHVRGLATSDGIGSRTIGGTGCLPTPWNTVEVTYAKRENVQGSILSDAIPLSDRRTTHDLEIRIRAYRYIYEGEHVFTLMPARFLVSNSESLEDGFGAETIDVSAVPFEWVWRRHGFAGGDASLQAFAIHHVEQADDVNDGDHRTQVATFTPLKLDGFQLAPQISFGLDLGIAMGWVYDRSELRGLSAGEVVPPPKFSRTTGHVATWLGVAMPQLFGARATARVHYERTLSPAYGGQFVLENRGTGKVTLASDKVAAHGEAFLGHATVVRPGVNAGNAIYGAGGDVAYALLSRVHAVGRIEAARTLAPAAAMDPVDTTWDLRATIGLTAHVDKRW